MSPALRDRRPIGGDGVTQQKAVMEKYTDGFRRGDLAQIMSCSSDDAVWALHGTKALAATTISPRRPTSAAGAIRN
jgi:hypothetical protein